MHTGAISRKLVIKTIKTVHFQSIKNVKLRKFRIECCVFTEKIVSKVRNAETQQKKDVSKKPINLQCVLAIFR